MKGKLVKKIVACTLAVSLLGGGDRITESIC